MKKTKLFRNQNLQYVIMEFKNSFIIPYNETKRGKYPIFRFPTFSLKPQITLFFCLLGIGAALASLSALLLRRGGCNSYILPPRPAHHISESPIFLVHPLWLKKIFSLQINFKIWIFHTFLYLSYLLFLISSFSCFIQNIPLR